LADDEAAKPGYVFRAVEFVSGDNGALAPTAGAAAESAAHVEIERPDTAIAQAFLTKVATPERPAPPAADANMSTEEGFKRFAIDLAPYFLAEYAARGVDVNIVEKGRAHAHGTCAVSPWMPPAATVAADGIAAIATATADEHDFTRFVVPLLQKHRPSLAHCGVEDVALVLQPGAWALHTACAARAKGDTKAVSLDALLYDDAFVHSLLVRGPGAVAAQALPSPPSLTRLPRADVEAAAQRPGQGAAALRAGAGGGAARGRLCARRTHTAQRLARGGG